MPPQSIVALSASLTSVSYQLPLSSALFKFFCCGPCDLSSCCSATLSYLKNWTYNLSMESSLLAICFVNSRRTSLYDHLNDHSIYSSVRPRHTLSPPTLLQTLPNCTVFSAMQVVNLRVVHGRTQALLEVNGDSTFDDLKEVSSTRIYIVLTEDELNLEYRRLISHNVSSTERVWNEQHSYCAL